jgi:hypothetical protein
MIKNLVVGNSVIVNLPANGSKHLVTHSARVGFNPMYWALEQGLDLRHWWLGVPTTDSIKLFSEACQTLVLPTVFIQNHHKDWGKRWTTLDMSEGEKAAELLPWEMQNLILPNYHIDDMEVLETNRLGFIQALLNLQQNPSTSRLTIMQGQRLTSWMREMMENLHTIVSNRPIQKVTSSDATETSDDSQRRRGKAKSAVVAS